MGSGIMITYDANIKVRNINKPVEQDEIFKFTSWIECPRWVKMTTLLKQMAIMSGLDIEIQEDKGLLTETVFFTIKGTERKIIEFDKFLRESINKYNEL
jgi:hypothetical protein